MSHPRPPACRHPGSAALLAALGALVLSGCAATSREAHATPTAAPPVTAHPAVPPAGGRPTATSSASPATTPTAAATRPEGPAQLPRGGRTIFPAYRLVGFCGAPGSASLGRLGIGDLDQRVNEIESVAAGYASGRQILPVLELVATVVQERPGRDGMHRTRASDDIIAQYLAAARRHRALLLLNIGPGRAQFIDEVRAYERWLKEPDVGLALDPEWAIGPGQVPGRVFGAVTGAQLEQVARYVSDLVVRGDLPEKVIVYHQLRLSVVRTVAALQPHPGLAVVQSVDGIGNRADKEATWRTVTAARPAFVHPGFKLFYDEDRQQGALMTPSEVLALQPQPEYILYK